MRNYFILFILSLVGILILKTQKKLMPKSYFYYSRLIDGIDEEISLIGATFRFLTPVIIGIITGIVFFIIDANNNLAVSGSIAAFGTIFLLIWPDILNPELISREYQNKKGKLFGLYLILAIFFPALGYLGGKITKIIILNYKGSLSWIDINAIWNSILAAFLFTIFSAFFMRIYIRFLKKSD